MKKKILFIITLLVLVIGVSLAWHFRPNKDMLSLPDQPVELQKQLTELQHILDNPKDILEGKISAEQLPKVTEIKVYKSKRYMDIYSGEVIIRRYAMRLGFEPKGHKKEEGDGKTPEGKYLLDWRNPNSQYYKSFHVSYPNKADKEQAEKRKVSAGGDIMIHGSSNKMKSRDDFLYHRVSNRDWTLGCMAISNAAIDELWLLMPNGTPIEIFP